MRYQTSPYCFDKQEQRFISTVIKETVMKERQLGLARFIELPGVWIGAELIKKGDIPDHWGVKLWGHDWIAQTGVRFTHYNDQYDRFGNVKADSVLEIHEAGLIINPVNFERDMLMLKMNDL